MSQQTSSDYADAEITDRFGFEEAFDHVTCTDTLKQYRLWSIPVSALYILLVFLGRRWMKDRAPYRLKGALVLWNVILGIFSTLGAWRTLPPLSRAALTKGLHSTVCDSTYYNKNYMGVWGFLFTLSKILEFGDTAFIVLRKRRLIVLHWYHHASVLLLVIAVYTELSAPGVWFCVMNYSVHALMYPYYGLRAAGFRLPKYVSMTITSLQIFQMVMGNSLVIYAAVMRYRDVPCHVGNGDLVISVAFYFSYLVLFAHFFYTAYFSGKHGSAGTQREDAGDKQVTNDVRNGVKGHRSVNNNSGQGIRKRDFDRQA